MLTVLLQLRRWQDEMPVTYLACSAGTFSAGYVWSGGSSDCGKICFVCGCFGSFHRITDYDDADQSCQQLFHGRNCICRRGRCRKSSIVLYSDIYWTCPHACADAYTAATFRWTDHDLVEHCICENYLTSTGVITDKISICSARITIISFSLSVIFFILSQRRIIPPSFFRTRYPPKFFI